MLVIIFNTLSIHTINRYQLSVTKGSGDQQVNATVLVPADRYNDIRDFLQTLKIIIISANIYAGDISSFGVIEIGIIWSDNIPCPCIPNLTDLSEIATIATRLWLTIQYIKSLNGSFDEANALSIVQTVVEKTKQQISQQEQQKKKEEQERQRIYQDPAYQQLQEMVNQTLIDHEELIQKTSWSVDAFLIKKLWESIEELKKLRMWTNREKVTETLEHIFGIMEQIDIQYLESQKAYEVKIMNDSLISNNDVAWELDKYNKAQKTHQAGTTKSSQDTYYIFFGKLWLYQTFLWKELIWKFSQLHSILYWFFEYVHLCSILIIMIYTITAIIMNQILLSNLYDELLYKEMISWWVRWILLSIANLIKIRHTVYLCGLGFIVALLYFQIYTFLLINIAL